MTEDHPIFSKIREWAETVPPPLVAFAPNDEFQREVDLAVLRDPKLGNEYMKEQFWNTYRYSAALAWALYGAPFGCEVHETIYRVACGNPLAYALCDAAGQSMQLNLRIFRTFGESMRLPGFLDALEVWTNHHGYGCAFNGVEQLPFVLKEIVDKRSPYADFWHSACKDGFPDIFAFRAADFEAQRKLDDAKRKRAERGAKDRKAIYRDLIAWGWLPLSLWARTAAGIVFVLDPEQKDAIKAEGRVKRDISTLRFAKSHHGEHQSDIDQAENS